MDYTDVNTVLSNMRLTETNDDYCVALDMSMDMVDKYLAICKAFREYQYDGLSKDMAFKEIINIIATIPKRYFEGD